MAAKITTARDLGELIRDVRKQRGLTQVQLAALCGVSPRFVGEVESGRASAGVGRVLRVCARLGLDVVVEQRGEAR